MADFNATLTKALAQYIGDNMPTLQQVLDEWPTANIMMKLPAVSVTTLRSVMVPYQTARAVVGEVDLDENTASVLYQVGHHDATLQIDVWAKSKPERATLSDLLSDIINKDIIPAGLRLTLAGYENRVADVLITEKKYADGTSTAQTQEWRTIFTVVATCAAVRRSTEFVITSSETVFDTPKTIE